MSAVVAADSQHAPPCPACSAATHSKEDLFCRRCGCRLSLECKHCHAKIRPLDRFCASCGCRRMIIFDQIRQGIIMHSPYVALGLAVVLGGAWIGLRYSLRIRL